TPAPGSPALSLHDALPISKGWGRARTCRAGPLSRLPRGGAERRLRPFQPGLAQGALAFEDVDVGGPLQGLADGVEALQHLVLARSEEHTSELQSRENLVCR